MNLTRPAALPPCRERAVEFTLPPIESAAHRRDDEGGHLGTRRRPDHAGRGSADCRRSRHTFVRAIETSDFERPLRLVEAEDFNQPDEAAGVNGAGPNGYYYNP